IDRVSIPVMVIEHLEPFNKDVRPAFIWKAVPFALLPEVRDPTQERSLEFVDIPERLDANDLAVRPPRSRLPNTTAGRIGPSDLESIAVLQDVQPPRIRRLTSQRRTHPRWERRVFDREVVLSEQHHGHHRIVLSTGIADPMRINKPSAFGSSGVIPG